MNPRTVLVALLLGVAVGFAMSWALRSPAPRAATELDSSGTDGWALRHPADAREGDRVRFVAFWRDPGTRLSFGPDPGAYDVVGTSRLPAEPSVCEVWGVLEGGRVRIVRADCSPL